MVCDGMAVSLQLDLPCLRREIYSVFDAPGSVPLAAMWPNMGRHALISLTA